MFRPKNDTYRRDFFLRKGEATGSNSLLIADASRGGAARTSGRPFHFLGPLMPPLPCSALDRERGAVLEPLLFMPVGQDSQTG